MGNRNTNLHRAKSIRDDEFYTRYEDIEKELAHYTRHFLGKTVLCNCDHPMQSQFVRYFLKNFLLLGLRRFVCTSISECYKNVLLSRCETENGRGYLLDVNIADIDKGFKSDDEVTQFLKQKVKRLEGDGDFRNTECMQYLKQADIVVTNPPFSLFKELVGLLMKYKKNFLLVGNQNALTYKEIFPLIQTNKVWTGYQFGEMKFRVPSSSIPREIRYWEDATGQKWRSLGNAMWLTNLDIERRHKEMLLHKKYTPEEFPKYDTYDAINVKRITDIPFDYWGIMGVPITIINRYNCEQFEIVGEANHGSDNAYDLFVPKIGGKLLFKKILIRLRGKGKREVPRFKILDLFCGAGGFSYGMEKNKNFRTEVALDFNAKAIDTFSYNMPDASTVVGDITKPNVREKIIEMSRARGVNMIIGGPPCQGFSLKGKKLGLADPRNFLFNAYLNIVDALQPQVFVIENVKALLSTSAGWFKNQIASRVMAMGYKVEYGVLKASDFGVPQSRERAIFICSRNIHIPLPKSTCEKIVTVRDAISDLAYLESNEGGFELDYTTVATSAYQRLMRKGSKMLYNHKASNHDAIAIEKLRWIPPECGKEYLPRMMRGRQKFSGTWGRLKWDAVSPTIDTRFDACSNGTNNHPFLNRAITPREAARLQSFDDKFVFIGAKVYIRQQIGNAVPPLLAKAIADQIDMVLKDGEKERGEK